MQKCFVGAFLCLISIASAAPAEARIMGANSANGKGNVTAMPKAKNNIPSTAAKRAPNGKSTTGARFNVKANSSGEPPR